MRRVLISLLLFALLAMLGVVVINGMQIGDLQVGYSVQAIINKNNELDNDIKELQAKIDKEYNVARTDLDLSFQKLQAEKRTYLNTITYTSEEDVEAANTTELYKLDYLWTTIGVNATKNNVAMKADLSHGSSGVANQYNIAFTAVGEYLSIAEFVYAIEKDDTLGFRIEEFALVPYSEEYLQATFIIKNVPIDPASLSSASSVSTGTVTNGEGANNNETGEPPRSIGGVTVMSDMNNSTNNTNSTNTNTNSGNTNTNTNR